MKKLSDITVILDRSASMNAVRKATIDGFNEFLDTQRQAKGKALLTLIQFNAGYEVVYEGVPIEEVENLTEATFAPNGMTALNDAIGRTIDGVGKRLAETKLKQRPRDVMMVILTDGEENSSREYNRADVAARVKHQEDVYKWKFMFIGANQDAVLTAKTYNIPANSALSYAHNVSATRNTFRAMGQTVSETRLTGNALNFTDDMRKKAMVDDD